MALIYVLKIFKYLYIIGAKCGYLGGAGLEPVAPVSGAVEEAVVWQDFTQTNRLQLNPKIMLIEFRL